MGDIEKYANILRTSADLNSETFLEWMGIARDSKNILSEATYFTCLKMLSETLGKMPIKYYRNTENGKEKAKSTKIYELLSVRPNPIMTPTIFWTVIENNRNHKGNGFAWIRHKFIKQKYGGRVEVMDLWPMPSANVTLLMDDKGVFGQKGKLYYQYDDKKSGETYVFKQESVLHFKTWLSFDGISGEPVQNILKHTINGGLQSQTFMNNLYEQGLTASMALQYTGDLDEGRMRKLQEKYEQYLTGAKNAGRIVPVPVGMQLQPLNVNLTDAQFFELRKYTSLQIAAAFGIKPNQINDYEKSSYANSESQQLSFLVDTMLYVLKQYEEEINYKLLTEQERNDGYYFKFNEKVLLRADMKTQSETLRNLVQGNIYTPNEAREYLDKGKKEDGDRLYANGNIIPLELAGKQYTKGSDNSAKDFTVPE
ncbi:phage portal protein [Anaerocolumna aminovalerica]|uniref:phage portal protein n=1 Tax=Anaerocolumna aminovalerica TaxID=1527 RepID=UPI002ED289AF